MGMMTNDARRVGRSRMCWFGFWVLCVPPPAIHASRRSSCSRRVILPWAWSSIRFERCEPPRYSACTNGRARMACRVPSIARRRFDPARIRSWACVSSVGLATDPVSNTRFAVCRVAICTSTVRGLLRDATHKSPSPLTSLQRVEATDALPILKRSVMSRVRRGPATCLRFCTVRERCVCVRHGEVRQPI